MIRLPPGEELKKEDGELPGVTLATVDFSYASVPVARAPGAI